MAEGGRVHTKCFVLSYAVKTTRGLVEYYETRRSVISFLFFPLLVAFRTCSRLKIHTAQQDSIPGINERTEIGLSKCSK